MTNQTYLVFSATGRQGRAVINALVSKGETSIVATSRNPESDSFSQALLKIDGVTKVIRADYNDPDRSTLPPRSLKLHAFGSPLTFGVSHGFKLKGHVKRKL